ncbi:MAG: hypothetical protein EP300_13760 [Gammaproteobacteria bacterium]|nr:MAG: hypothetical protein EP300_13760 [Gammaproteobacteria bacterium]
MQLKHLVPMLNVSNIESSLDFYQNALGFEVISDPAAVSESRWATIRSGHTELMLSESRREPGPRKVEDPHEDTDWPVIFYFYPDDVVRLYSHMLAGGFKPTALRVTHYGMREFSLIDPDGHVLSFGQDAAASARPAGAV